MMQIYLRKKFVLIDKRMAYYYTSQNMFRDFTTMLPAFNTSGSWHGRQLQNKLFINEISIGTSRSLKGSHFTAIMIGQGIFGGNVRSHLLLIWVYQLISYIFITNQNYMYNKEHFIGTIFMSEYNWYNLWLWV